MAGWPSEWNQRFAEVGITGSKIFPSLDGDDRTVALVTLFKDVFAKVNYGSEEEYRAICEEFYPGGKIDRLSKEISQITQQSFDNIDIPQDALLQVQRQIIEGDDAGHMASYPPRFLQNLKACRALLIACSMDPEIAAHFSPKSLRGSFGAKLHYIIENVPLSDTLESSALAIIKYKNENGIDALQRKKAFIIKCPSEETERSGISPHEEVCREEWAYVLQQLMGVDFGVPPTVCAWMPFESSMQWCSIQEFIDDAVEFDGRPDEFYHSIKKEEVHKLIFDIIIFSTDRAFRNLMTSVEKQIVLIDNGLTFPEPSDFGLREGQFQWMSLPQTDLPMTGTSVTSQLESINTQTLLQQFKSKTQQIAIRSKGWSNPIGQNTQDLIHFSLLLVKKGIELQIPMQNVATTMVPIRVGNELRGGEVVTMMKKIQNMRDSTGNVNWKAVEREVESFLVKQIPEREMQQMGLFLAHWIGTGLKI